MKKCIYSCDNKECKNDSLNSVIFTIEIHIELEHINFHLCSKCLKEFKKYFNNIDASWEAKSYVSV